MTRLFRPDLTLEQLQASGRDTLIEHLGIELIELGEDFLRGSLRVDSRSCQPMRILHGGASVALAETLASAAANALVDPARAFCVGQEINANHLRPAAEGSRVTGTARAFHVGARSQVWGVEICDDHGSRVCIARVTMAVVIKAPANVR